ncbi:hypothetical protein ABK040_010608 [Willaertia magna]
MEEKVIIDALCYIDDYNKFISKDGPFTNLLKSKNLSLSDHNISNNNISNNDNNSINSNINYNEFQQLILKKQINQMIQQELNSKNSNNIDYNNTNIENYEFNFYHSKTNLKEYFTKMLNENKFNSLFPENKKQNNEFLYLYQTNTSLNCLSKYGINTFKNLNENLKKEIKLLENEKNKILENCNEINKKRKLNQFENLNEMNRINNQLEKSNHFIFKLKREEKLLQLQIKKKKM